MFGADLEPLGTTWVELEGEICGAQADERGPIGGGEGYSQGVEPEGEPVETLDALLNALASAKSGDVVFIHGEAEIDCTERVYIESLVLEVPGGVTVASNRGDGGAPGGMILSDTFDTKPLIKIMGPGARITGLRIKGPNPKRCLEHHNRSFREGRGHEYYYKFPTSDGIDTKFGDLEVDNCELGGWSRAAIHISAGDGHRIHHNFIHHNQYNGLGYGVSHDTAFSTIEYNLFDSNRHSLAGTGRAGSGYEARHNVELGESLSHCFDMHGGRDRKDGTDVAGSWMKVHHNTFRCPKTAVVVRGLPEEGVEVNNNWLYQDPDELSVRVDGKTQVFNNAYGLDNPVFVAEGEARVR